MNIFIALALLLFPFRAMADVAEKIQSASSLIESGDFDGAQKLLQEVVAENPQSGPAHLMLGQIALQQFQWQEAEKQLKLATSLPTRRPHLALHLLGRLYLLKHDYKPALDAFNQALQQEPSFAPAMVGRARAKLFLNQVEEAVSDLKGATNAPEAAYLYSQILVFQNRVEEAKNVLGAIPENFPGASWLLTVLKKAPQQEINQILSKNLAAPEAYFCAAIFYRDRGNLEKFRSLLQISFQLDDQNPAPQLFLKSASVSPPRIPHPQLIEKISEMSKAIDQNQFDQAQHLADEVIAACDRCVPAYLVLADGFERQHKLWDALEQYEKIDAWLPDLPEILTDVVGLERKMGAFHAAECEVRRAIAADPQNGSLYYLLASIQKEAKNIDGAIESCRKASANGYDHAQLYVLLGDLYYEKMEIPESIAAMQKAMNLDPQSAESIASFALAQLTTEDYATLRASLEKYGEAHPDSVNTNYALGVMYLNENNLASAKESFERLQKLAPRNSQVYYNLGLIYTRQGNETAAFAAMKRFRELKAEEQKDFNAANEAHRLRDEAQEALKSRDSAKAIALFSKILSGEHSQEDDLVGLAKAYQVQKDEGNAASCFSKALAQAPANEEALTGLMQTTTNKDVASQCQRRLNFLSKPCS